MCRNIIDDKVKPSKIKILVAIASFGQRNMEYLKEIILNYKRMTFSIDIVVLSDSPKPLANDIEVVVGLPSKDPWSLPFAHKAIFAARASAYDLFVYSEDDIGVTESNIAAFLEITQHLNSDEIAGFMRYEVDRDGTLFLDEPWGHFHWKPSSVARRGGYTIAEFTNEHSGFYIVTKAQLAGLLKSGGFLRAPTQGRYGLPETAATDPYTNCGFRKVVCVSELERFLIRHMSTKYVAQLDVSLESFREQIRVLFAILNEEHPGSSYYEVESSRWPARWQKSYYEKPEQVLLDLVPTGTRSVLSVGCGWGATEESLLKGGARVTALPLDSVIGEIARSRGVDVVYGRQQLEGRRFGCILLTNLLHLQRNPAEMIHALVQHLDPGGAFVLAGPNFSRLPVVLKRLLAVDGFGRLKSYELGGFTPCGPSSLAPLFAANGMNSLRIKWLNHSFDFRGLRTGWLHLGRLTARSWAMQVQ